MIDLPPIDQATPAIVRQAVARCDGGLNDACVLRVRAAINRTCFPFGVSASVPIDRACFTRNTEGEWTRQPWLTALEPYTVRPTLPLLRFAERRE